MSVPRPTGPLLVRGAQTTVRAGARSLRAMDRDRRGALAAAIAMPLVLLAPWYELTVTTPGADGRRRAVRQTLSGWQALSPAAVVCALVAVATGGWLLARCATIVDGLGTPARRTARSRIDGVPIAAAGALGALLCLISLASHPGPDVALPGATGVAHVRFGLVLGLLVALVLSALGGRIALASDDSQPDRNGRSDRLPSRRGRGGVARRGRPADGRPSRHSPLYWTSNADDRRPRP